MGRWQRRAACVLGVLAVFAAAGAGAPAQQAPAAPLSARGVDPPGGALVAPGNAPDLIFLHTGDVIGYLEPCG
jgi:hypothetical protein